MAGGGSSDGEPEFQVAPMVDVLSTILVFFMMITSAQVLKVDKTITLPVASDALKRDSQRSEVVINVRWHAEGENAEFVVNDHAYATASSLSAPLRVAKALGEKQVSKSTNPTFRAVIRSDQNVPAVYVSQIMNACGEVGICNILLRLSTSNPCAVTTQSENIASGNAPRSWSLVTCQANVLSVGHRMDGSLPNLLGD